MEHQKVLLISLSFVLCMCCLEALVASAKPGICPSTREGPCVELCSQDNDCPGPLKCCYNGCGHVCSAPSTRDCIDTGHECVSDCHRMAEGDYQSCRSCHMYVTCVHDQFHERPCPNSLVWDDNAKRCMKNSTTCKASKCKTLQMKNYKEQEIRENFPFNRVPKRKHCNSTGSMCVRDCTGKKDGDYQSCHGCDVYVSCVAGYRYDDRPCAPGGLLWDDKKKRCEWTSTTCNGCTCPDCPPHPCHGTGPRCVKSCTGMSDGDYQSCNGCNVYMTCSNGYRYDNRPCAPGGTVWDDNKKLCDWHSDTCYNCKKY